MTKAIGRLLATAAFVGTAFGSAHAQAPVAADAVESDADAGGDIIVTARKRAEALQDVPAPITAFGAEQIDRLKINGVDVTPSFYEHTDRWHVTLGDSDQDR